MKQKENRQMMKFRFDPRTVKLLRLAAKRGKTTMTGIVETCLALHIGRKAK